MKKLLLSYLCLTILSVTTAVAADRTTYAEGSRPKILINWQSFEDQGFPSDWRNYFQNVVINAYTRVNQIIGVDVLPQFFGYTDKFDASPGEIVISANEKHADSNRLASTFGYFPDRLIIVFHRKRGSDLTPWNWTPFWPNSGEYSMYAVMMHELLHTLGLDHSAATKTIMNNYTWTAHFGPWSGDINDMRALYRLRDQNRLRQLATYDGGLNWSTLNNNITGFGSTTARTTHEVAAGANQSDASYIVGWVTPGNRITWIRGDGIDFDPATWTIFGGGPEVMFGTTITGDRNGTYLWAIVDTANDERRVRVLRSFDNATTWHYVNFPVTRTYGRPGIARTYSGGQEVWIAVWANYNESNRNETGFLYYSTSTNEGSSWSNPQRLNSFYRVHDGVSIACNDSNDCELSFVWSGEKGGSEYGQNRIRTMELNYNGSGLMVSRTCYQTESSRVAPGIAWHFGSGQHVLGIREQDFNTSQNSMSSAPGECPRSYQHISSSTTHAAPGLASNPAYNETVMWSVRE